MQLRYIPFLIISCLSHYYKWILPHFYFSVNQPAQYLHIYCIYTMIIIMQMQFIIGVCSGVPRDGMHRESSQLATKRMAVEFSGGPLSKSFVYFVLHSYILLKSTTLLTVIFLATTHFSVEDCHLGPSSLTHNFMDANNLYVQ